MERCSEATSDTDANERSELEQARTLRALVDNLGVGVFSIDNRTGRVIAANPAYARILGFGSVEEAIGSSVFDHYDDPKERAETFARFLASPEVRERRPIRFEAVRVRQDTGRPVPVFMTVSVVRDAKGDVTRLDGIIEDIGERKRVEKAFDASERRFRLLFENAAVGVVITNPDRVITRVNRAFCGFIGYEETELAGKHLNQLLHPDDQYLVEQLSSDGDSVGRGSQEWRFVGGAGETVWGVVTVTWLRTEDGEPLSAVLMVQDVTSRKRMEEELLRVEKLESLGLLAGGIAHDFNNILAAILGNVSLAAMMTDGNEELAEALERASEATLRARGLTSKLMTFAKGGHPVKAVTSVAELLRRSVSTCLRGTSVVPRFDMHPDLACAELDAAQMEQVFANLIVNAMQAMPRGGQVLVAARNVTFGADSGLPLPPGRYVQVDISDEGAGIPSEHLAHLFDPFFAGWEAGTGLGLATAHSVVKRHGGHVVAHSEIGVGSTFSVYLAAAEVDETAAIEVRPAVSIAGSGRVLVMDDEPDVQRVAAAMLRSCGIEADLVSDGATALTTFAAAADAGRPYVAVILDLTVPGGLGGAEIIGRLREIDPKLRAIVSSGYSVSPVLSEYRRHGFAGVLPKPYTIADLRNALEAVLRE